MFRNKFRNIFSAETMFPSLSKYFQHNRHVQEQISCEKMMLHHVSNILDQFTPNVSTAVFPSLPTLENMEKQRKETMSPQQCFPLCPGLN
jgi:nitrogenase subunit NifH